METPSIVHECASWMVVNKPSGMHTVDQRSTVSTLEGWLSESFVWARGLPESGIVHRLDGLTSGAVLVATTIPEYERLRALVRASSGMAKVYVALARSGLDDRGRFELYFSSRYRRSKRITVRDQGEADDLGRCEWRVVRRAVELSGDSHEFDLVVIAIRGPGRRHQIRAGLAHLGHGLLGDEMYRSARTSDEGSTSGVFGLHSYGMRVDGTTVRCPWPSTWPVTGDSDVIASATGLLRS